MTRSELGAPPTVPPVLDPALADELSRWHTGETASSDGGWHLARLLTCQIRRVGRHHLGEALLDSLTRVQDQARAHAPFLAAFLDSVLARRRGQFRNQTYLALPLLGLILADAGSRLDPERLSALVVADVVHHENRASSVARSDPDTRRKRSAHARRFVAAVGATDISTLPEAPDTAAASWLPLTALPVSDVHDEYFFLRVLQAHELVFTTLTAHLHTATRALRAGRPDVAAAAVKRANGVFGRAALLFRIVATLRPSQFHAFRVFTDGASAIQSESYKRFEIACGSPTPARLRSDAFTNVPAVRAEVAATDNLSRAYADLCRQGRADEPATRALATAVGELEAAHQRWKTTHHRLAARMLGDAPGSGYTAGVPYLRGCLDNRLFTGPCPV